MLFNTSTMMEFDRVTFNLSFPLCWLLMSLYKYVCMFSLLQHTIGFPLCFPTWPDGYVPLVAPDGPPHLLNGDQHKQNISLETYGLIALVVVMEDLWETHNKQPLINKIHFIPLLLQLSIWLLLGVKCAATKKSCSNLIKALLSVGLIVFKVQLL